METAWVYNALEAAYQDTGDEALASYYVRDDRSDDGYLQIYIYSNSAASVNVFRRYAANIKPYYCNMNIRNCGTHYDAEFWEN